MMKIAVYNKSAHIKTMGGGEKVMALLVKYLMENHDVTLLSEEVVNLSEFRDKFDIDITKVNYIALPSEMQISEKTKDFDIFFNVSHGITNLKGQAKYNIHYISFPQKIKLKFLILNPLFVNLFSFILNIFNKNLLDYEIVEGEHGQQRLGNKFINIWPYKLRESFLITIKKGNANEIILHMHNLPEKEFIEKYLQFEINGIKVEPLIYKNELKFNVINFKEDFISLNCFCNESNIENIWKEPLLLSVRNLSYSDSLKDKISLYLINKKSIIKKYNFLNSYQKFLSNSNFTGSWTKKYWNKTTSTLYPPCGIKVPQLEKENKIITIGRFFDLEHSKKHIPMIMAFRKLHDKGMVKDWELHMCGASVKLPEHLKYLRIVKYLAQGYPIYIHEDIDFDELNKLLSKSKIFWHATGYNQDINKDPINFEHFGITTVEAMISGAVPVVINKAGQTETVEHKKSGFLWDTLKELRIYTLKLMSDENLRQEMSKNSLERSKIFDTNAFNRNVENILKEITNEK